MAIFILVAGSWHGAWCWERVVPMLQTAGHRALTPELVGTGQDAAHAANASLAVWADQIAALAELQSEPVVLGRT